MFDGFGKWFELYRKTADMFLCRCRLKGIRGIARCLGAVIKKQTGVLQTETFAKFLSLPTAETQTQVFGCFHLKSLLILPKYPLNPPRIPDNQASGLP
ncbi:hypothetical protein, partial [Neisseria meningitidis]|uniref:hypothetical protein n=1 Tax=Neisseria meningitidis TaxID=487 RepID=UPI003F68A983